MKVLSKSPILAIVVAQLLGTSLWFSPNSAADDLVRAWSLSTIQLGQLTSAVQIGFIVGTLLLSTSGLADRFPASRIFCISCLLGSAFNAIFALAPISFNQALLARCAVGVCLAGIYPLGMKMVISWSKANAGQALGVLVAMLTMGTALPHGVRAMGGAWPWQAVVLTSSVLALLSGVVIFALGDGPYLARARGGRKASWGQAITVFRDPTFRSCAIGYFGHMWELYAFWTAVPFLIAGVLSATGATSRTTSAIAFAVIASGALGCIVAGRMSRLIGSARVAAGALAISGAMCLVYPVVAACADVSVCVSALVVWGVAVIADSAQFSAISARACPPNLIGSALAIQNSIGFLVTVPPISLVTGNIDHLGAKVAWLLLPGPIVGLVFFRGLLGAVSAEHR
ncbi:MULTISPECIES: MFS transporter [unclassified Burkholderia]|uniref:MFS transporter n=1 Tax=unclassified Burkholderia TaxID=2613784 RepID=UPI002ABD8EC9|nr:MULTISPECIES: MFS transporter [unclassified Burkholderia]